MELDFNNVCKHTLSANEIRQFDECPRRRYYASRDCLAIRSNTPRSSLFLGSVFHNALAYYYTEFGKIVEAHPGIDYDELVELAEELPPFEPQIVGPDGEIKELAEGDVGTFNNIIEQYMPQLLQDVLDYEIIGCEVNFNMNNWPIDTVMFHGIIDMIVRDRKNNKIYFFEHKTCAGFRPEIYSRFDVQLHIYAQYGYNTYGAEFGGMILNQVKKSKTERGYDQQRDVYTYEEEELNDFYMWLSSKTEALISPRNLHTPCNNYMTCKTCEYQDICMKYGYKVPRTHEEIVDDKSFTDEEGKPLFSYDPREDTEENN